MGRLLVAFVPGVLSSLAAEWLIAQWTSLPPLGRWSLAIILGVLTAFVIWRLVTGTQKSRDATRIATNIQGNNLDIEGIKVRQGSGDLDVASDVETQGDIRISRVDVERGHEQ